MVNKKSSPHNYRQSCEQVSFLISTTIEVKTTNYIFSKIHTHAHIKISTHTNAFWYENVKLYKYCSWYSDNAISRYNSLAFTLCRLPWENEWNFAKISTYENGHLWNEMCVGWCVCLDVCISMWRFLCMWMLINTFATSVWMLLFLFPHL